MGFKNLREARKNLSLKDFRRLHEKAEHAVANLQKSELHLIKILQIIESHMVHRWCGYNSLFEYGVQCLKLSRSQSYMYVRLAKVSRKYKKLNKALIDRKVTPSKAARVLVVMNTENEEEWIKKASTLPKSQLEKEVARLNPKKVRGERSEYLTSDVIEMKTPVSEEVYKMLIKVQDLLSSAKGKAVSMEGVFSQLANDYLERKDPVQKARRKLQRTQRGTKITVQLEKSAKIVRNKPEMLRSSTPLRERWNFEQTNLQDNFENSKSQCTEIPPTNSQNTDMPETKSQGFILPNRNSGKDLSTPAKNSKGVRLPIPAEILHRVHLRDQGQCQHHYPSGGRCKSTRWLHKHHVIPASHGGKHSVENIISLCPAHHELAHVLMESKKSERSLPGQISDNLEF